MKDPFLYPSWKRLLDAGGRAAGNGGPFPFRARRQAAPRIRAAARQTTPRAASSLSFVPPIPRCFR